MTFFLRCPALFHEAEEMGQRVFVRTPFTLRELPGALVELYGQPCSLVGRTAQLLQRAGEGIKVHDQNKTRRARALRVGLKSGYLSESFATILMLFTSTRSCGLLFSPPPPRAVGVLAIFSSTSSPRMSVPNAVYF